MQEAFSCFYAFLVCGRRALHWPYLHANLIGDDLCSLFSWFSTSAWGGKLERYVTLEANSFISKGENKNPNFGLPFNLHPQGGFLGSLIIWISKLIFWCHLTQVFVFIFDGPQPWREGGHEVPSPSLSPMTLVALHGLLTPTDHSLFSKPSRVVSVRHWWSLSCTQKQVLSCSSLLMAKWWPQVFQGSTAGALVRMFLLWSFLGHCGAPSFTLLLGLAQNGRLVLMFILQWILTSSFQESLLMAQISTWKMA